MNFIMTKFVYPLKQKMELFDGYYFDNPRTPEEIKYVEQFVRKATPFPPNDRLAGGEGFITIDFIIDNMKTRYANDDYVAEYIDNCKYKDSCYKIASMWVILRLKEEKCADDFFECAEKIHSRIDTLTLLAFEENHYIDFSVLISGEYLELYEEHIVSRIQNSIIEILVESTKKKSKKIKKEEYRFNGFLCFYNDIVEVNKKIEEVPNKELIAYVMESIQAMRKNRDLKMKFVSIVSIIELLLTHSPDYARFNVEESISKQFKNKVALACYLYDKGCDCELIREECKIIYSLRSDIAHGNFGVFPKDLNRYFAFCKKYNFIYFDEFDSVNVLEKLMSRTLNYMTTILKLYMNDYKLYDIIKSV